MSQENLFTNEIYSEHKFPYKWNLKDAVFTKDKGKVFSCFACGGGSTMGYKLSGFDVLGCNEIDKKMISCYIENHKPKYAYNEDIRIFKQRNDLPDELYNLDILDGSPPCSSFSVIGNREADWGKEKVFKEGQAKQVLDTLFFDFIDLAKKLQPKIVVAENVKGLLLGNAYRYYEKIHTEFKKAGYKINAWLLNAKNMGVPQSRERVFIIGVRNDLCNNLIPKIDMNFNEEEISFKEIDEIDNSITVTAMYPSIISMWKDAKPGEEFYRRHSTLKKAQGSYKINPEKVINTIVANENGGAYHHFHIRSMTKLEILYATTFPEDYDFIDNKIKFICGMSVPPVMMAQIALRIYNAYLK